MKWYTFFADLQNKTYPSHAAEGMMAVEHCASSTWYAFISMFLLFSSP